MLFKIRKTSFATLHPHTHTRSPRLPSHHHSLHLLLLVPPSFPFRKPNYFQLVNCRLRTGAGSGGNVAPAGSRRLPTPLGERSGLGGARGGPGAAVGGFPALVAGGGLRRRGGGGGGEGREEAPRGWSAPRSWLSGF